MIPYLYIILSCFTISGIARRIVLCEPSDCHNEGTCVGDKCVCAEGFRGSFCEIDKCDEINCRNDGICAQGSCICLPGFAGNRCQRKLTCGSSDPCHNEGACVDENCVCAEGFRGNFCQIDKCDKIECLNDGTCAQGSCTCPEGFAGNRCQRKLTCGSSDPCHNEGACVDEKCVCAEGFRGNFCQIDKCDKIDCLNDGTCEQGSCTCPEGFAGNRCQRKLTCGSSDPCHNEGTCVDENCVCAEGFRGNFCQIDKCNNRCRNGGTCEQAQGSCTCPAGFAGRRCQDKLTSVECGSSSMTVNIDQGLVIGKASDVHFRDQSCSGEYSSIPNEITLTTDYSQCGTSFEEDETTITFTNVITYAKPNPEDGTDITREYQLQVKVECCLNKEEDVDGTFKFQQARAP
ncbi:neurogenic locus Notch protein [Strongylocentrotus purpuratus]|uniref:Uncharacterized protein n=1 Tax=Strongylocentrotus purpuratus TaxID=7668 RepID=A0A7M7NRF7_STRPU|nr:neurogenic locus Notch protein [Strongylocentrotus purpuratus]